MITLYAYTYPGAKQKFPGYILVKVGDTIREADTRINEQGGAAEYEAKIKLATWPNLKKIERDRVVHGVLTARGLHHADVRNGSKSRGTEWFKIPATTEEEAVAYLDSVVTSLEGHVVRKAVTLRNLQQKTLDQAMSIFDSAVHGGSSDVSIIANLCPRFGKTLWALSLFNRITEKYGNRVMLLPAYWLSAHTSFTDELGKYADFLDIVEIDPKSDTAASDATAALAAGKRLLIPISLHGALDVWKQTHAWVAALDNNDIFSFADEGDFGTHAENQVEKMNFLFAC